MRPPSNRFGGRLKSRTAGRKVARSRVIAIAYDGERTEDRYFKGWKLRLGSVGFDIKPYFIRSGGNVLAAVEECIKWVTKDGPFDEIYCVCDVDDTDAQTVNEAAQRAREHGITLCLSTRSFEVWIALHWSKISLAPLTCESDAISLVSRHHAAYCKKAKEVDFDILFPLTAEACRNASWLERQGIINPATDVHNLIEKLLQAYQKRLKNPK